MTRTEALELMDAVAAWAAAQPSCRAMALAGSWAREAARDESDLDLLVLTDRIDHWTGDGAWLGGLLSDKGFSVESIDMETYGAARSWRARLASGAELELTFADLDWAEINPIDAGTRRVAEDGLRVLIDKDGRLGRLMTALNRPSPPSST
jgi:hypothetical protein